MKVVILAGGLGTRISEYTKIIPKPMIRVNKKPIIYYIMKHYSNYGFKDFYIALGYKGHIIKKYFKKNNFGWNINLIDTGQKTMTGGRLKRLKKHLGNEPFMLTYGDGLSNVNIKKLLNFHKKNKKLVTLTAARPPARFGAIKILGNKVKYFKEKSKLDEGWINGGFFVMQPEFLNYIKNDQTFLEREPMELLTKKNQLVAFKHDNFWQCMDTKRDMDNLNIILKNKNYFE
ncbi:sugar phosphate nucleotidyltransferase [Candidatus Pelagibacter sp.]|nr:sugar phosphate nucleotidyltransferase [Candidatus Pelagibacter sp.]